MQLVQHLALLLKKIALVLSNIDRKIELNRAINQNLPTPDRSLEVGEVRLAA